MDNRRPDETMSPEDLGQAKQEEESRLGELERDRIALLEVWREACEDFFEWIVRDLGYLGIDVGSLRGFYSDSLAMASESDGSSETDGLCQISARVEVRDAVHVALAADWKDAGWAAAQVWPDGTRMGAESIGRLRRSVASSDLDNLCEEDLDVLDAQGRSVSLQQPDAPSRLLSQSVPSRTAISG